MGHLTVFAQPFTVVTGDDDQGVVEHAGLSEPSKKTTEGGVSKRNLVVIRLGHVSFRCVIRIVGIEKMGPGKPRRRLRGGPNLVGDRHNPITGSTKDLRSSALDEVGGERRRDLIKAIVIFVESLGQAEPGIEHERANEGASPITSRAKDFGERGPRLCQAVGPVVAHAVGGWGEPCHDRRMRG